MDKTARDFLASLEVMEANLALFHQKKLQFYRPLATELRKLLCDGSSSLLPRVFEDIQLHKLAATESFETGPAWRRAATLFSSSTLLITKDIRRATLDVAESGARMPLEEWLEQRFLSPQFGIREFIKSVADKEGAHADPKPNATLAFTGSITYGGDVSHGHEIAALSEYILEFVRKEDLRVRAGIGLRRQAVGDAWQAA